MVDAYELSEDNEGNMLYAFILSYFGTYLIFCFSSINFIILINVSM